MYRKSAISDDAELVEHTAEDSQRFLAAIVECSEDGIAAFTPAGNFRVSGRRGHRHESVRSGGDELLSCETGNTETAVECAGQKAAELSGKTRST